MLQGPKWHCKETKWVP